MAFPTIPTAGASTLLTNSQADTSGTRNFPSLSSLTKSAGDLLIAIVIVYQASTTNATFSAWGGSFTEFLDVGTGGSTIGIGAAYKWSTGSETGAFTVTQAATVTGHAGTILIAIPGAHASTPPEGGSFASGTSTAADPASFAPSWGTAEDVLWIAVMGNGETATGGSFTGWSATPTNYGSAGGYAFTADVVGGMQGATAYRQLNASSENVGTWSLDTSNARNAAAVIAVRPAAVPAPPRHGFVNYQDPGVFAVKRGISVPRLWKPKLWVPQRPVIGVS